MELLMRIILAVVLLLAGCGKDNKIYCEGAPDNNCNNLGDAPRCTDDPSCICDKGVCVECTVDEERNCMGTTPQCGDDNKCRACRANDECPAGSACLEDGACADPNRVIAASPTGVNTSPCGGPGQSECSITQALVEVNAPRDIIRLAAGMYTVGGGDGLDFNLKSATVVARGATIERTAPNGPIMSARNGQTLTLIGGTLQGPNNTTDGLRCSSEGKLRVHETTIDDMTQSGIEVDLCDLTVSRATIRNNDGGGINMTVSRVAKITNNFVYRNGNNASMIGGMSLLLAPGSTLEFNTVVNNQTTSTMGFAGGIFCDSNNNYEPPYNIVYRNQGGLGNTVQVIGSCVFQSTKSYVLGTTDPSENTVGFQDPNKLTDPSFRLTASSPETVRDVFDCRDVLDFEGDRRPAPDGGKCDYGADEFRMGQ